VADLDDALKSAAASGRLALLDVATDPGAHPPISLYEGKLDQVIDGRVVQKSVA
jgi:acetolactate synthase I/II/III large subunit